jgi:hypothetical protein
LSFCHGNLDKNYSAEEYSKAIAEFVRSCEKYCRLK